MAVSGKETAGSRVQVVYAGESAESVGQLQVGVSGSRTLDEKEGALCEWMTHQRPQR